ncbi:TnsD family Tn7-like transposition protein [Clostridium sp.]|uniref:TnsD family Tn7-like transposition protein n=1 Tax=Clostridium sp. TaxID=1506 RepID=UPI002FC7CBD9
MVTFFPTPYPNETLYSVIARYHIWSGNLTVKTTLRDLFNTTTITAGRELPANVNLLLRNLPKNCILTADEIIKKHTLYKYYTSFLPIERAKQVYDLMLERNGSLIYTSLGMCNNTIKTHSLLKYCNYCIEEDRYNHGEAYWHIEHQLQGTIMCHKHFCELKISNKSVELRNRQEYLNLDMTISSEDRVLINLNKNIIEHQKTYSKNVNIIINSNLEYKQMNFFREHYLKYLIDKGMAESRMKIYQEELLRDIKSYYGEEYLTLLGCNYDTKNGFNWVTAITRKHRKSFHTIQHLLMIEYLNIDIEALFNADYLEVKKGKTYLVKTDEEKAVYREKWLKLRIGYLNKSKSFMKDLDCATYTWLSRYDRKWLDENSPLKRTYGYSKRINWEKRDEELLKKVTEVIKSMYNSTEKPERITIGAVGRKIGKAYLLQKYTDIMPKTKAYLNEQVETVEDFQERRINWVRENLVKNGESEWIIRRKAGVR